MDYTVKYHRFVLEKDAPKLSHAVQVKVEKAIREKIQVQPERFGKPLRKSLKGSRRLRVGDYRIIYRIQEGTVFVWAIGHRATIYRVALSRFLAA